MDSYLNKAYPDVFGSYPLLYWGHAHMVVRLREGMLQSHDYILTFYGPVT